MNEAAITRARVHLDRAKDAIGAIGAIVQGSIEQPWYDFLIAGNAIYSALKQGAKDTPKSRQWLGAEKRPERHQDPLLSYMLHSRNAIEHGIGAVLEKGPEKRGLEAIKGMGEFKTRWKMEGLFAIFDLPDGSKKQVQLGPPDYKLIPVFDDRSNRWYDPPTHHLGKKLRSNSPYVVSKLWLKYLTSLIDEAETYLPGAYPP